MAFNVARSSFSHQSLVAWTDTLWNRWSDLVNIQESYDAEYVVVLKLLLTMKNKTHSPDWSKWASNYSMDKTKAKDFKVRQFLVNTVLAEKIEVLSKTARTNTSKLRPISFMAMKRRASRATTTMLVVAVPTSRLRILVEPSSFHAEGQQQRWWWWQFQ